MVQNKRVLDSTTGMTYPYGYEPTEAIFDAITLPVLFEEKEEEPQRDAEPLGLRHTFPLVTGFKRELKSTVKVKKKACLDCTCALPNDLSQGLVHTLLPKYKSFLSLFTTKSQGVKGPLLGHTKVPMTSLPLPLQFPREYSRD